MSQSNVYRPHHDNHTSRAVGFGLFFTGLLGSLCRHGLLCLILLLSMIMMNGGVVQAEQPTVSQRAHQGLESARDLLQKGQWSQAEKLLGGLVEELSQEPYAQAVALQMRGYALSEAGRHENALQSFQKALDLNVLEGDAQRQVLYNMAQVLVILKRPGEAVQRIEAWLKGIDSLTVEQRVQVASIYYGAGRYKQAADHLARAIDGVRNPKDEWLEMLVAALHHSGNHAALARRLPMLIERRPGKKHYWLQLAGSYLHMNRPRQAAAVLSVAHHTGLLREPADIIRLAQLFRQAGVPRMGCEVLQNALGEQRISGTPENYEMLADAWLQAREARRAARVLQRRAEIQSCCKSRLRLGQLLVELEDWPAARDQLQRAASERCRGVREKAQLLLGIAAYHSGNVEDARKAFAQARQAPDLRGQAEGWLRILDTPGLPVERHEG